MIKLLLFLSACLALSSCRTVPVAGECPESASLRCLSRKVCTEDAKRGCLVCTCESVWETDPSRQEDRQRGRVAD
jgi:hypothetical protein